MIERKKSAIAPASDDGGEFCEGKGRLLGLFGHLHLKTRGRQAGLPGRAVAEAHVVEAQPSHGDGEHGERADHQAQESGFSSGHRRHLLHPVSSSCARGPLAALISVKKGVDRSAIDLAQGGGVRHAAILRKRRPEKPS
jgi:hypothetical protein